MNCDEWQLQEDVTTLNVANKQLTAEDAVLLAGVLAHNKIVEQVDVSSNNLGVEGGKALAECLKSNTTITQVCLCLSMHAICKKRVAAAIFLQSHMLGKFC